MPYKTIDWFASNLKRLDTGPIKYLHLPSNYHWHKSFKSRKLQAMFLFRPKDLPAGMGLDENENVYNFISRKNVVGRIATVKLPKNGNDAT